MRQTSGTRKSHGEKVVEDIRRATRKQYSAEEKTRIVLDGLKGEDIIARLCHREGIAQGLYYSWSKEFPEAGNKRLAGDTARAASTSEVKDPRREAPDLKEVVAEQALDSKNIVFSVQRWNEEAPAICGRGACRVGSEFSALNDQMLGTIGKTGDVGVALVVVIRNDKDVMLAVTASARQVVRDGDHRFHRNNHARLQHRVAIFA